MALRNSPMTSGCSRAQRWFGAVKNPPGQIALTVTPWGAQCAGELDHGGLGGLVAAASDSTVGDHSGNGGDVDDAASGPPQDHFPADKTGA
jgi:hypothetical protein